MSETPIELLQRQLSECQRDFAAAQKECEELRAEVERLRAERTNDQINYSDEQERDQCAYDILKAEKDEAINLLDYADGLIAKHETIGTPETMWRDQYRHWKAAKDAE